MVLADKLVTGSPDVEGSNLGVAELGGSCLGR